MSSDDQGPASGQDADGSGTATDLSTLANLRMSIDNLDTAIICLFAERFKLTQRVGVFKRDNNLPSSDPEREAEQIARLLEISRGAGLDPEFMTGLMRFIISHVIRHHEAIRRSGDPEDAAKPLE